MPILMTPREHWRARAEAWRIGYGRSFPRALLEAAMDLHRRMWVGSSVIRHSAFAPNPQFGPPQPDFETIPSLIRIEARNQIHSMIPFGPDVLGRVAFLS
jgi:hypothetical protein